jgi:hypothetical protein
MKTVTLTIDTYNKSFALHAAVKGRIDHLSELLSSKGLSGEVKDIFRKDLAELKAMQKQLDNWD